MKVTVCQLPENAEARDAAFEALATHVRLQRSDLVLLPEMPFDSWLARTKQADSNRWQTAVAAHTAASNNFPAMGTAVVAGTFPVLRDGRAYNEAFVWETKTGYQPVHLKYYLPEEEAFWEASWYRRGPGTFETRDTSAGKVGFLICTEMWFTDRARQYAREGMQLLLSPRATAGYSRDKWLAGGRAAAVMAGAFCLSSNRGGTDAHGLHWAGCGWIINPVGEVLGTTDDDQPFLTLDIDLGEANHAKTTYPRYVPE